MGAPRSREMTPKEVARMMNCHVGTIYRWVLTGKLKALRRAGPKGRYLIREVDALALLQPAEARWA